MIFNRSYFVGEEAWGSTKLTLLDLAVSHDEGLGFSGDPSVNLPYMIIHICRTPKWYP